MAKGPAYEFPAISDGRLWVPDTSLDDAAPGTVVTWGETLYAEDGDWKNGDWGEEIGIVMLRHYRTHDLAKTPVRAWFVFHNGHTAEFGGLVPGEGSWIGTGVLGFRGGTGRFATRTDKLSVESTNPKRWG